jgi:hypothetical protein
MPTKVGTPATATAKMPATAAAETPATAAKAAVHHKCQQQQGCLQQQRYPINSRDVSNTRDTARAGMAATYDISRNLRSNR